MRKSKTKWEIIILSPHMDDAVLSLGQHIIKWKNEGKKVKVISIFTKFGNGKNLPEYSKDYLEKSGFNSVKKFEEARISEDTEAMKKMGVDYEHWDFIDAGFREFYKTKRDLLSGKIDKGDQSLVKKIEGKIYNIRTDLLLVPYGVGNHVDHMIIKKAAEDKKNKRYYLDIPYLWEQFNFLKFFIIKRVKVKSLLVNVKDKIKVLKEYESQYILWNKNKNYYMEVTIEK